MKKVLGDQYSRGLLSIQGVEAVVDLAGKSGLRLMPYLVLLLVAEIALPYVVCLIYFPFFAVSLFECVQPVAGLAGMV